MRMLSAVAVASVAEIALAGAACGLLAIGGRWNGWLDLFAQFAPVWLVLSLVATALAWPVMAPGLDRWLVLAIAAVGVLSNGVLIAPELASALAPRPPAQAAATARLRLLTFNVWDEDIAPDAAVAAILAADADVVAVQEIGGLGEPQRQRLRAAYPYWAACQPTACDIALLSRSPWLNTDSRIIAVGGGLVLVWGETVAPDGGPLSVASTHLAWPIPPLPQAAQRRALAQLIKTLPPGDLVLTGDFNLAPWSAALASQDRALEPLSRRTRAVFTWPAIIGPARAPSPFPLLPIDHIYAGPNWRTVEIRRLARAGSDHYGVLATLTRTSGG